MISEFPLFCFTTLAGLAAGAYAIRAVFPISGRDSKQWIFPLACLALLGAGLIFLPFHLTHPERIPLALTQPGAMIAQEAYWSAAFGAIILVDFVVAKVKGLSPRALQMAGGVAALGLMVVMSNAYYVSLGVEAWASWQTFALFLFGDLAMGAALVIPLNGGGCRDGKLSWTMAVLGALAAVACVLEAMHFMASGSDGVLLVVGAILAVVAVIVAFVAKTEKWNPSALAWAAFLCAFAAVAFARYGFYAACVL